MRFDVAIVGAGPAGAWAARALALAGARVALFDASHPREKPCGGGLTARALAFLDEAGIRSRIPGVRIRTARFSSGPLNAAGAASVSVAGDSTDSLVVVSRSAMDQALAEAAVAAGACWIRERVVDLSFEAGTPRVRTTERTEEADFVLGADGANSLVRRRLLAPFSRRQISVAAGYYARGVSSDEILIHCVASPPGYIWSFPRTDHLAIGICAQADAAGVVELRHAVEEWLNRARVAEGAHLQRYCWPIPSLSHVDFHEERPGGRRWMLLGDAAGLVDPLTREGIFYALQSADHAAAALSGPGDAPTAYCDRLHDEVFPELARAAALKAGFFTSRFTDLLVDALGRSPRVQAIMADLIAGAQPYATLKHRLLQTFEVGLAWRLLKLQVRGRLS